MREQWTARAAAAAVVLATSAIAACGSEVDRGDAPPPSTIGDGAIVRDGVAFPVLDTFAGGAWVRTPCWGISAIDGEVIDRVDVVIDPGHGGRELGAVGEGGLREKDLNLDIALGVAERLRGEGVEVLLTRTIDAEMTIRTRAEVAAAVDPVAFVSIHHNAAADGPLDRPGTTVYRQHEGGASGELGQRLYDSVSSSFAAFDVSWVGKERPPVRSRTGEDGGDYYGILRYSVPVTAVILESAYLDNPPEEELLSTPEGRAAEVSAVAEAITAYLADPGPPNEQPRPVLPTAPPPDAEGCRDPEPLGG